MNKTCICNSCEKEFVPQMTHETIGKDKEGGDVMQSFFVCPHCGRRYNSLITDTTYRNMLKEYRKLGKAAHIAAIKNANPAKIKALINKMDHYEENTMKPYYAQMKQYWQTESKEADTVAE